MNGTIPDKKQGYSFLAGIDHDDVVPSATTTLLSSSDVPNQNDRGSFSQAGIQLERLNTPQRRRRDQSRESGRGDDKLKYDVVDDDAVSIVSADYRERETLLGLPTLHRTASFASTIADDSDPVPPSDAKEEPVSWSQLPKKGQLIILTLSRLSEPLTQTSLQSYMFYQLKSFTLPDGSAPSDATVARQAGMLQAAFTGAQFCTAMLWGRAADSEAFGRKRVILIGLLGTAIGSLGFGFSSSFAMAMFWRCVGGMLNGNIGVMRTMISETIREKKYQSRAFLLMPMTFNIGVIIGPLLGGLLADPVSSYPDLFGGIWWLTTWPYALPNVVNACFLTISALALVLGLEETLEGRRDKTDYGLKFSRWVGRVVFRMKPKQQSYTRVAGHGGDVEEEAERSVDATASKSNSQDSRRKLPLRRMWTPNLLATLLSHGLLAMHVGTFSSAWFVFLSTPRYDPEHVAHHTRSAVAASENEPLQTLPKNYHQHLPFTFTGGLALPPPSIGTALAILGVIGISLQLLLYPRLSFHLGTTTSFRLAILLFPISYFLTPYLATLPSWTAPPGQATGPWVWLGITVVLCIQVMARTFALPATAILVNNACPHPSCLGTLHGLAQSVSSGTRTIGPVAVGWLYGVGLNKGVVGLAWWVMAGVAVLGAIAGRFVRDGDGHEVELYEGEKEEMLRKHGKE